MAGPLLAALAVIVAAVVLASPLVYPRACHPLLALISRPALAGPLLPLTRLAVRRAARRGTVCSERLRDYVASAGDPGPLHLLAPHCPGEEILELALDSGVPEVLAVAAAAGCRVPEALAREAGEALVLLGRPDKARVLGVNAPRGAPVAVYCGGWVEAWTGGARFSSRSLRGGLRARVEAGFSASMLASGLEAPVVVSHGCPGGLGLESLVQLAYPEVPPGLDSIVYHLALDGPSGPGEAVAWAASIAAGQLLESGAHRLLDNPPRYVLELLSAIPARRRCPEARIVTDRPRLGCPYWTGWSLEPPRDPGRGRVWAALLSLAHRRGDPGLARHGPEGLVELAERYRVRVPQPPEGPVQLPPGSRAGEYLCLRPPSWCGARWRPKARPRIVDYSGVDAGLGEAAIDVAGRSSGRLLLVAPSRASAKYAARILGASWLDDPRGSEAWVLEEGGPGVVSWEGLLERPWLIDHADTVAHLFPEAYPGLEGDPGELAAYHGGPAASRVPGLFRDAILEEPGSPEAPPITLEEAVEAVEEEFSRLYPGYRMRPYQRVAAAVVLYRAASGPRRPVLTVLPTGSGKTAVYLSAGMAAKRLGLGLYLLVVSPLRALMRDQVEAARRRGLRAERIDASLPPRSRRRILEAAGNGGLDVLLVTPERFQDRALVDLVLRARPSLLVLDEAHAVARWGRSFRPGYLHAARLIGEILAEEGWPMTALYTATAPPGLAEEVLGLLDPTPPREHPLPLEDPEAPDPGIDQPLVLRGPILRRELEFDVAPAAEGEERVEQAARLARELAEWAGTVSEPWIGVVYTGYVRRARKTWTNADELAERLGEALGVGVVSYHGQLPAGERRRREDAIYNASRRGEGPRIVVATKAFGMGIDIPNIRWVLHFTPSDSVEDYYQEAGRAGRDGRPARIVALYNPRDFQEKASLLRAEALRPSHVARAYNALASLAKALRGERGGLPTVAVPAAALHPSSGRLVHAAARLGLLDYWVERVELAAYRVPMGVHPSDLFPWYMELPGRIVVAPKGDYGVEEAPLSFYRCGDRWGIIAVEAGGVRVESAPCGRWIRYPHGREQVIIAYWPPDKEPEPIEVPGPDAFQQLQRLAHEELELLEDLQALLEEALRARSRGGPGEADRVMRRGIEDYFTRPPRPSRDPPSGLLSRRRECEAPRECLEDALWTLTRAVEWLGPRAVTVAAQDEALAEALVRMYEEASGRAFEGRWKGMYKRIAAASRQGMVGVLDYGYIIVLAQAAPRRSVVLDRLQDYPYAALYAYRA